MGERVWKTSGGLRKCGGWKSAFRNESRCGYKPAPPCSSSCDLWVYTRKQAFAELIGVPVMVNTRPYAEQMAEFRPFACSDFVLPLLTKLCPPEEKMDRWAVWVCC